MEQILMVGEDFRLLATRAAVLSKTGAKVTCCNPSEFVAQLGNESYGVVVLCHTISEGMGNAIVKEAHQRWPRAKVLQIFSGLDRPASISGDVDAATRSEPKKILEHVSELLSLSA